MQVVLRGSSPSVYIFHEMDKGSERTLHQVKDQESDTPALVAIIEMLGFCLRHGCNSQNDPDEDNGSSECELEYPMPLEPITHERPGITCEKCSSGEEEQEPKNAEHSMPHDQLLVPLEGDRT